MTKEKSRQIVIDYLLNEGYTFVPISTCYSEPQAQRLNQIEHVLKQYPMHFFLTHPDLTIFEFSYSKILKDGKDCYYVSHKYGGPYLEFSDVGEHKKNEVKFYSEGSISIYSAYYKTDDGNYECLDMTNLRAHYKKVCNHIRKHTKVLTLINNRTFRITDDVIIEMENGSKLTGLPDGFIKKIT